MLYHMTAVELHPTLSGLRVVASEEVHARDYEAAQNQMLRRHPSAFRAVATCHLGELNVVREAK